MEQEQEESMSVNQATTGTEGARLLANPTRVDYTKARQAFRANDVEASREAHDQPLNGMHDEMPASHSEYLKAATFGALDGILTSFAIISGAAGGNLGPSVVLVLGFSNILADGLSMGLGEYLSTKATNEYIDLERKREEWELAHHRQGEIDEMVEVYTQRGMSREDAQEVLARLSKYDRFFVDVMMAEELGMPAYAGPLDEGASLREGLLMFAAFAFFGMLPLLTYCVGPVAYPDASRDQLFLVATAVTGVCLFAVGATKSHYSSRSWMCSGLETLVLGGCCAGLAYEIGAVVAPWVEGMD